MIIEAKQVSLSPYDAFFHPQESSFMHAYDSSDLYSRVTTDTQRELFVEYHVFNQQSIIAYTEFYPNDNSNFNSSGPSIQIMSQNYMKIKKKKKESNASDSR